MTVLMWTAVLSLFAGAAALGVVAWRTRRGERDRESARVELLKRLAFPDPSDELTYEVARPAVTGEEQPIAQRPWWISILTAAAPVVLLVALYALLASFPWSVGDTTPGARRPAASGAARSADDRTTAVRAKPIEVIALRYELGLATSFQVSGLVRNPVDGRPLSDLTADVELLDASGRVITSQMTPLERPVLEAGQTAAFSVVFPHVTGTVARYQVRFREPGGDALPQIDRRGTAPLKNAARETSAGVGQTSRFARARQG